MCNRELHKFLSKPRIDNQLESYTLPHKFRIFIRMILAFPKKKNTSEIDIYAGFGPNNYEAHGPVSDSTTNGSQYQT